jgi:hypothetical protein
VSDLNTWAEDIDAAVAGPPRVNGRLKLEPVEAADPLLVQWAKFRDQFAEAMTGGFWTIEDLETKIAEKRAFFFPGRDAAMVAEIVIYPGGTRAFQVMWACGSVPELLQMAPGVEAMARMMGCDEVLIEGQEAWKRLLKPLGYELFSVTVRKAL